MSLLEDHVVLVTGGGNGIGKACALLAAQEGAKVIVNDLGVGVTGDVDASTNPAEQVAEEIRAAGGQAASNTDSITDRNASRRMVEQALDTFGRLDAVINPAGILRDGMFHKMADEDWDAVIDVHLNGHYNIARAAIERFRDQQSGSFVFFVSTSGLIGNIGQANYAAAKMGVMGLSRILAMEGAQKNVRSNCIAPFAWTRMTKSIPVKDEASRQRVERMKKAMRADQVAPLAVALSAPAAKHVTGQVFAVRGNEIFLMSQPRPIRGLARTDGWTPETVLDHAFTVMKPEMYDLSPSAGVFSWDPV